jgi:hypothetical protein
MDLITLFHDPTQFSIMYSSFMLGSALSNYDKKFMEGFIFNE